MSGVAWWLQAGGLSVGFFGAVLLVISQQGVPGGVAGQVTKGRFDAFVVLRHPQAWSFGFGLLCLGFLLQLAAMFA